MTLADLTRVSTLAYPALPLERIIKRRARRIIRWFLLAALVVVLGAAALAKFLPASNLPTEALFGVGLLLLGLWLGAVLLEAFFLVSYFRERGGAADFDVAFILASLSDTDVTASFLQTKAGKLLMLRAGVTSAKLEDFLTKRVGRFAPGQCVAVQDDQDPALSFPELVRSIYERDSEWSAFLFSQGVQAADLLAWADWLARAGRRGRGRERWWSREALGRLPGIGKDWAFGQAYALEKYALPLPGSALGEREYDYNRAVVEKVEAALSRAAEANVMLVGDDGERKMEIMASLARLIERGEAYPAIEAKRLVFFDATAFSAQHNEKSAFEQALIAALNATVRSGNIIVVVPEFTALARSASALGGDLPALLDAYLAGTGLQLVALVTLEEFHNLWEGKPLVAERFEKIILDNVAGDSLLPILEDEAANLELARPVFFTGPALKAAADGALRYVADGILPDAAIDLLVDAAAAAGRQAAIIGQAEIEALIKNKTGIPIGSIGAAERAKLNNLENELRERLVGQEEAVTDLASALRRSRAGIGNPNRPIGSFLFLGPTGVGKTEMTKALAEAYFGGEEEIHRLDMSEYSSAEALEKLIGSFTTGSSGVLADMIREHPYGILLLDEFEKASGKVHNLFLQILDEGFFSDSGGKRVSVRNQMIIATSNAGSDLIWRALSEGHLGPEGLAGEKPKIIDELIKQNIFKPELLNRFDAVVLFHPLLAPELKEVARLQLIRLAERLKTKGYVLNIGNELVDYLAESGADPKFGARAMNRLIQDQVERVIAEKIVSAALAPGSIITLTRSDFAAQTPAMI